jgi:hypothetical protein
MHVGIDFSRWFWELLGDAPRLVWLLMGTILCYKHARAQPRRAMLIGTAFGIQAINYALFTCWGRMLMDWLDSITNETMIADAAYEIIFGIPQAFSLLLIVWAAFLGDSLTPRGETHD